MERVERALDELGYGNFEWYKKEAGNYYGLVEFWTDTAGQDIPTEIDFDGTVEDFVEKFTEAAESYDVDDQVEMYVNMRGKNGVPNSVRELLDDCQEAKDTLMKIADKLQKMVT